MAAHLARTPTQSRRESLLLRVPEERRALVWATFPGVMAGVIARAPTQEARRALLESVPPDLNGADLRARVEVMARHAYRRRRRG